MQYFTLVILYICNVTCMSLAVTAVNMNIITATVQTCYAWVLLLLQRITHFDSLLLFSPVEAAVYCQTVWYLKSLRLVTLYTNALGDATQLDTLA